MKRACLSSADHLSQLKPKKKSKTKFLPFAFVSCSILLSEWDIEAAGWDMTAFRTRYYLKLDEGIRRLPKAFLFDLQSKHAFRQFAGTKQKIIEAVHGGGILELSGSYIHFDAKGHLDREPSRHAAVNLLDAADSIARAKRMKVVDLPMIIKGKAQLSHHRWQVTDADRKIIVADLVETGRRHKGIPILCAQKPT